MFQFPVEMARIMPVVIMSLWLSREERASNWEVRICFLVFSSMLFFRSALNFLKRSSKRRDKSWPALMLVRYGG